MPAVAALDGAGAGGGIGGDPGAIEAAAARAGRAASAVDRAGRSVSGHGDAVVASWIGSASAAAHERIRFLGERTVIGADVLTDLPAILTTYAAALRAAQARYAAGAAGATAAATQAAAASAELAALDDEGTVGVDPRHGQRQAAATDAARAAAEAGAAGAAAEHAMAGAVADEEVANEIAAAAVGALSAQMPAMRTTMAAAGSSPAAADRADGYHRRAGAALPQVAGRPSPTAVDHADHLARGGAAASAFGDDPGRGYGLSPMSRSELHAAREAMRNNAAGVAGALVEDVGTVLALADAGVQAAWGESFGQAYAQDTDDVETVEGWTADLVGAEPDSTAYHDGQNAYTALSLLAGAGALVKGAVRLTELAVARTAGKKAAGEAAEQAAEGGAQEAEHAPADPRALAAPLPKAPPAVPARYAHLPVVEAASGVKGSRPPGGPALKGTWDEQLRRFAPDTVYRVDGRQLFITDDAGRVAHVKADLQLRTGVDLGDHTLSSAGTAVRDGPDTVPGDQSGHLIGNSLGGPSEEINRVPMSVTQNGPGQPDNWYAWEGDMRTILQGDQAAGRVSDLRVDLQIVYPDDPAVSVRPQVFRVNVTDHGEPIVEASFENTPKGAPYPSAPRTPAPVP